MAELVVKVHELSSLPVPELCARTGRRATRTAKVTITHMPWWAWLGLLGGIVPFLVIALLTQRKVSVYLPHAAGRAAQQRAAFAGGVLTGIALPFFLMGAYFEPGLPAFVALVCCAAAFAGCVAATRAALVRGRWVDVETVRLVGLHPGFAAALGAEIAGRRAAVGPSAGWYADPSGQYALRWFDGGQWTAYVDGAAALPRAAYG
ncbi:MAG TPA: DUF2510 domain-containing protein [Frankiaceae bacterium]|nr:DUF2510 domain-containing protein [Frankiaceae bacterium]